MDRFYMDKQRRALTRQEVHRIPSVDRPLRSIQTVFSVPVLGVLLFLLTPTGSWAVGRVLLDHCCIVIGPDQPSYVKYGVEDLAGYLTQLTGSKVSVGALPDGTSRVRIAIGQGAARRVLAHAVSPQQLGEEGYLLRYVHKDGVDYVVSTGASPRGTKAGIAALMKRVRAESRSAFIEIPLDVTSRPAFAKRGLHFNGWPFHYPYTFRAWREQDWRNYLDILAYQQVNLFYLWPFIEIMPVPLSKEDQAYLEECRRVVDYAQRKHGMEVWIMQCTNRVASDRCGVADPRLRPYWRPSQQDLNPGNPDHLRVILKSREALYRIVNNVDGVCNIDSDPGYFAGSPLSDYVKVLQGCRTLLDRHNLHGKQAKLIDWMWFGWGLNTQRTSELDHQALTVRSLKQGLPEPWWLVSGQFKYLPLCRQLGVLPKTVLLPYGMIEGEPSYPATNVEIDALRAEFAAHVGNSPELAGVMGNVQTALLQFPHVFFFTSAIWDMDYCKRPEKEVLSDLALQLYPEHHELLADAFLGLKESNPTKVAALASRLDELVQHDKLGRTGLFARKLFPDHHIVAQGLVLQLRLRAARQRLIQSVTATPDEAPWARQVQDYLEAHLAWETAHGWHTLWGWEGVSMGALSSDPRFPVLAAKLARGLCGPTGVDAFFQQIGTALAAKYDTRSVNEGCIVPLKKAVLSAQLIESLAQKAKATASVTPDPVRYPASAANDGILATQYWPGALVESNTEWLQLTWDTQQSFDTVVVRFLQHPSMASRTIHLQKELATGRWEDFATIVIKRDPAAEYAVATFRLPKRVSLDKIRVVNLLDLFEIEVR
jgi:hypothetical protein